MRTPAIAVLLLALTTAPLAAQERQEMGNEPPALSDANIAAIVVVANQADIDNGELVLEKGVDERVRAFANQMIESHTAINEAAGELVVDLGVTPEASEVSRSIHDGQATARERLEDLSGAEFDRAYIANEVTYHEAVIDAVDNVLIPSAQNEQLKQTLIDVRPAFVSHLEQARSIQEGLTGM
jgi:putative membrane protein